jgi:membrane protease YdiL (CAAX protease family)
LLSADNRLFDLARTGHLRIPNRFSDRTKQFIDGVIYPIIVAIFGLAWPLALLLAAVPLALLGLFIGFDLQPLLDNVQNLSPAWLIVAFLPVYLIVWAWLKLFEKRGLRTVGFEEEGVLWKYGRGLIIGLLLFTASLTILAIFNTVSIEEGARLILNTGTSTSVILIFVGWMVQGGAEEVLSRGFLLPIIGTRFGTIAGIVVSSLIFSMLHLFNPGLSTLGFINLLLFSLFAALFALYEGGLWGICAMHGMWNWAQGNLFGFRVSGIDNSSTTIFDFMTNGPDWLTGGEFGPEGGAVVTVVYLVAIALVFLAHRLQNNREQQRSPSF